MRHVRRFAAAIPLILIATTTGCAEGEPKTAPELPEQFCWNAFDRNDVQPFLPKGDRLSQDADAFRFSERKRFASCLIHVDGNSAFSARATFEENEALLEWSSFDRLKPDTVHIGKKGIVWNTGARTYFPCKTPGDSDTSTANYLELDIFLSGARLQNHRKSLPGLLTQFTTFAQKELKCA
ncbi:hypothetical protein [Streptomyces cyaneofuscatus]|uniref:DUF3558 domain-containing protein n=1 Tax=Streptomyces cyaneofuscatus TaxID=66883 RepID=A0ABZ1F3U4_9ACTN|nr:hypothetical protein [Streptomyces cyaneofuscatus]WSB11090.1 hypothetical protein OG849_29495 [Streptomyces cyaneofuscatus]WSD45377.1 hypothetical protein OG857_05910 [Streptomyces cyaneofuscatus]